MEMGFRNDGGSVLAKLSPYAKPHNTIDGDSRHEPEYSDLQFLNLKIQDGHFLFSKHEHGSIKGIVYISPPRARAALFLNSRPNKNPIPNIRCFGTSCTSERGRHCIGLPVNIDLRDILCFLEIHSGPFRRIVSPE